MVAPFVSAGGAAAWLRSAPATLTRAAAPWHDVQVRLITSMVPFRWAAALTVVAVYPLWQDAHAVPAGWVPPGGRPWQEPQAAAAAPPSQDGARVVAPFLKLPWQ